MASIPKPATLAIAVGDFINVKGQHYIITAVGAGVDDNKGTINYAVTTSQGVITVNASNCVLSEEPSPNAVGGATWVQSANA